MTTCCYITTHELSLGGCQLVFVQAVVVGLPGSYGLYNVLHKVLSPRELLAGVDHTWEVAHQLLHFHCHASHCNGRRGLIDLGGVDAR